jgi:hypothetical protein
MQSSIFAQDFWLEQIVFVKGEKEKTNQHVS